MRVATVRLFRSDALNELFRQKHSVRVVPVSEASCVWSDYKGSFYVYGLESRVFAPDYPQKHCMGICTIL